MIMFECELQLSSIFTSAMASINEYIIKLKYDVIRIFENVVHTKALDYIRSLSK